MTEERRRAQGVALGSPRGGDHDHEGAGLSKARVGVLVDWVGR